MGNGRRLKEAFGDAVKIVAAEPMQGEPVQGLRSLDDGFIPPIIDISLLDRKIFVTNRDAIIWTRKLLDEEGLFAGVSSGAIASIAVRIAGELDEGNVVFVVADDGWKYLSSGIYTLPVDEIENLDVDRVVVAARRGRRTAAAMNISARAARRAARARPRGPRNECCGVVAVEPPRTAAARPRACLPRAQPARAARCASRSSRGNCSSSANAIEERRLGDRRDLPLARRAARPIRPRPTSTSPPTGRASSGSSSGSPSDAAPEVRSYLIEGAEVREVAVAAAGA